MRGDHNLDQLFEVGALAHRGLPTFIGGLCGDFSPHRTTMTQTKCCPIFAFWVVVVCLSNGSSRGHRALEGSSLPSCFDPFVILPRLATPALRLGVIGSLRPSVLFLLRRCGRRSGQPSSSSLARRACVHVLPFRLFGYWVTLNFARSLASPEAEGRWQWRSLRPLALPSFVARFAPLRCTPDAVPLVPVQ